MLRRACVAGQFYPGDPAALKNALGKFLKPGEAGKEKAVAIIAPHAGYMYSGAVAGAVYSTVEIPDDVILIGPNHTGLGKRASIMASGEWETPIGRAVINAELAGMVLKESGLFSEDTTAHAAEHSLEVQLPFILALNKNASIVPITVMHSGLNDCSEMGRAIARAVKKYGRTVLLAVSSDMNHYESDDVTRKKDRFAIDKVLALDARGLLEVTEEKDITMCGAIPSAIAIVASKELGAKGARLVKYATSGDAGGDYSQVVGYAGIVIS